MTKEEWEFAQALEVLPLKVQQRITDYIRENARLREELEKLGATLVDADIQKAISNAALIEREACAKVADEQRRTGMGGYAQACIVIAAAIRARGQAKGET